jgi:hypothetical protein
MAPRDSFLLRIDPKVLDAIRRWARDELRSVNGQIEFMLRKSLSDNGRMNSTSGRMNSASKKKSEDKSE